MVSLLYQPQAMRLARSCGILTNTPPRRAQSQPGGMQGITVIEPVLAKAARQLGDRSGGHPQDQCAGRQGASSGPPNPRGQQAYATSAFVKEIARQGREMFNWQERMARSGKRVGTKVRGTGVAVEHVRRRVYRLRRLFIIRPDGTMQVQTGIGNLGTEAFSDVHRVAAEMMGMPWEKVETRLGQFQQAPAVELCVGRQPDHPRAYALRARGSHRRHQEGAGDCRQDARRSARSSTRSPTSASPAAAAACRWPTSRRRRSNSAASTTATKCPTTSTRSPRRRPQALVGQGLMGVARDNYKRDGGSYSFVAGFAEVEIDVETGAYQLIDYLAVVDVGTVIHPRALGGQVLGRSILGMGHALGPEVGLRPALRRAAGHAVLPEPAADDPRRADQHAVGGARHSRSRRRRSVRAALASRRLPPAAARF